MPQDGMPVIHCFCDEISVNKHCKQNCPLFCFKLFLTQNILSEIFFLQNSDSYFLYSIFCCTIFYDATHLSLTYTGKYKYRICSESGRF